jgi:ribosome-associated protein
LRDNFTNASHNVGEESDPNLPTYNLEEPMISTGGPPLEALDIAKEIVDAASDRQANDIVVLDLRRVSLIADYFVICSGTSERQITAILDSILDRLRTGHHIHVRRQEGKPSSGWVLLDYGDVVVHIFAPEERELYQLEEVWSHAQPVVRVQ